MWYAAQVAKCVGALQSNSPLGRVTFQTNTANNVVVFGGGDVTLQVGGYGLYGGPANPTVVNATAPAGVYFRPVGGVVTVDSPTPFRPPCTSRSAEPTSSGFALRRTFSW
jgi:hypothetical protein